MNINKKMQDILKKHKSDRKKASWTVILSLVVVLTVITSLITPAISMTIEDSPLAAMGLIGALGENSEKKEDSASGALEIKKESEYVKALSVIPVGLENEYNGDSASVEFSLDYVLSADSRNSLNLNGSPNLYIPLNNFQADYLLDEDVKLNTISDTAWGGGVAGTFEITPNGISVTFTPEYKEYLQDLSGGDITGNIQFSGEIKRDESEDGDKTVTIAGEEIKVKFKDRVPEVSKKALTNVYSNDNDEKVVKWEVNITSNGTDLSKYSVSDIIKETYSDFQGNSTINSAPANIKDIKFNPSEAGKLNDDGTILLSGTQNVTIIYETVVHTQGDGMWESFPDKIENEFEIKYGNDDSHVGRAEKKPEGLNIAKTGEPDYATGKIKWTVTINNPLGMFLDWNGDGYTIDDTIKSSVADEKITFSTPTVKEPANGQISDDWKLSGIGNAKRVVIEYETTAEAGHTYTNEVEMKWNEFVPSVKSDPAVVKYKDISEVVKLDKNGNYLENKHEIEWTITASADGNYKFEGYEVTDEKFPANANDVTITYYKDGEVVAGANGAVKDGKKYTITDSADEQSFDTVKFVYKTKVEVPEKDATVTNVVNKVEGGKDTATTVVSDNVYVQFRNGITKKLSNSKDKTTTVVGSEEYSKTFEWEVILNRDAKFAGQTYTDTISAPANATHALINDSIKVYASKDGEDYDEEITTGYTVNKTADGFTLKFANDFDSTNEYNFVKIKYKTTATIEAVEDDATDYKSYEFKNVGEWGGNKKESKPTIERKKPVDITVQKMWDGMEDGNNAVFELQFKSTLTQWSWSPVKWDGENNYVLLKDSELESVRITLDSSKNNVFTFSNLPSDAYYRVVEVSFTDGENTITPYNSETRYVDNRYIPKDENGNAKDFWYDISYSPDVNNNGINKTQTITVTNARKENPTKNLEVKKAFGDGVTEGMFEDITVQLQRKRTDRSDWEPYSDETSPKTATLNSENKWFCKWENLPYQELDNGYVITYEYRVVETAYTKKGENVSSVINGEVYKIDGKYYQYTGSEKEGTYTITNSEYKNDETKEITPYKFWAGDDNFKTDRPDKVIFVLQKKNYDGEWEDVHGTLNTSDSTKVIVDESSDKIIEITLSGDKNGYNYLYESGIPNVNNLFGLPKYAIHENEDGIVERYEIEYNFRESAIIVNGERIEPENGIFKTENGSYRPEKEYEGAVKNYFTSTLGVEKTALDDKGNSISYIDSADLKQNEDCPYYAEIDGEKYYVFNWQISYKDASQLSTLEDELPAGFTLCTDSRYGDNHDTVYHYWLPSNVDKTPEGVLTYFDTKYYKTPVKISGDYTCTALPVDSAEEIFNINNNNYTYDLKYYYDDGENKVYFSKYNNTGAPEPTICYSIKIPCEDLENMLKTGNKPVTNKIKTFGDDGEETGSAEGTLTITVPSDLISKSFKSSGIPGYVQYTIDVNPEGKNLSNGSTIDIKDIFKTNSYTDTCHNNTVTEGDKLVDVLMDRLKLYKVDANGVKSELGQNEYTMKFASGKSAKDSTALLELSIPDEMHVEIQYTYKIVANENTPSVKNGCKSAVIKNNKYDTMKPGYVPPTGHKIAFENKAQLISDSATAEDIHTENEYRISRSSGTISTNGRPKIKKVDVGNYSINNLDATFLMAEYKDDAWYFAETISDDGTVTWSETPMSGDMVDEEAGDIEVKKEVALEQEMLYKLIEVSVPEGYEGSKLFENKAKFRELIVNYLNAGKTELDGKDYSTFLNKYVSTHYFVYNSDISSVVTPDSVSSDDIMQIRSGDDIEIPNSKLIDIGVAKKWYGGTVDDDAEIIVELYWSYEKSTSGIPTSAKPASADDLGIMSSSFVPEKSLTMSELNNAGAIWTDLPNGKDSKPIYYYVKEKAYKVDKITYTLDESGKFVSSSDVDGGYLPVYVGNALNDNGTVTIKNSNKLALVKEWKNSNGKPISAPVSEITVTVYGIKNDGNKTLLFKDVKLGSDNDWRSDLPTESINLSEYKSFEVTEKPDPSGYVVSCVFNINQNTGEITVTNKNTNATDVTVSVKKHWSDGETVHLKDSVNVVLYQSTEPLANLDKTTISNAIDDETLTKYKSITLSANKEDEVLNWAYSWTGLPLHKIDVDGNEDASVTYYYYVFEESMELIDSNLADKYETTYKDSKSGINTLYDYTISNTRNAIVVQKKWIDEGEELADNEIPASIEVVIYKKNGEAKEYLTENGTTGNLDTAKRYTVSADGSWTAAIDVPAGDDKYYVEEVDLSSIWEASVDNNGQKAGSETPVTITNERNVQTTSIEVKKIWVGNPDDDTKALLPNNFYLLRCTMNADGTYTDYEPVNTDDPRPVEGSEDVWRYDNLPVQDANGKTYYYTVDEIEIDGYSKTPANPIEIFEAKAADNSGTVEITNTEQISITVNKDWSDGKDKHNLDSIEVQLYRSTSADDTAEGEPVGKPVIIDAKAKWTYTFSGLDVYKGDDVYYYWVVESSVNGYTPTYTYTDGDDDTKNTVNASKRGDGVIEILNTSNFTDSIELPSTGGKGTAPYHMAGMLIIGGSLFGIIYYRRRRRRA